MTLDLNTALVPPPSGDRVSVDALLAKARRAFDADNFAAARAICLEIQAVTPDAGEPHFLLGLIAYIQRDAAAAIFHFTASLRDATSAPRFSYLADALRLKGDMVTAQAMARTAAAIDPALPMAWASLGARAGEQGESARGARFFARAMSLGARNRAMIPRGLAACLSQMGKHAEAEAACREALLIDILDADSHVTMAEILMNQDRIKEAICEATLALRITPGSGDTHAVLATALLAAGKSDQAHASLTAAIEVSPRRADLRIIQAESLIALHRPEDALAAAETALSLARPADEYRIHMLRADALETLRRGHEALAAFDAAQSAAEALDVQSPYVEVERIRLMLDLDQLDEKTGLARLNEIEARHPGFIPAIVSRADLKKFTAGDADIPHMLAELRGRQADTSPRTAGLHFALGKAYLDLKDGDQAFYHLNKANSIRRSRIDYDPRSTEERVENLISLYDADPWRGASTLDATGPTPIFVCGMARSGTSLTEQILASHPAVTGGGELAFLPKIERELAEAVGGSRNILAAPPGLLAEYGQRYRDQIARLSDGKPYVVDKMPGNYRNIGLIRLILPDAKIIHTRRDPLDTCLSCYSKSFHDEMKYTFNQEELGRYYRAYERVTDHWRAILPADAWLELEYEETIADQHAQTEKLLAYVGLPWDDACLSFHETQRQVQTASTRQVRRPLYSSSVHVSRQYERHLLPLIRALRNEPAPALTFTLDNRTDAGQSSRAYFELSPMS